MRVRAWNSRFLRTGSGSYARRVAEEVEHYRECHHGAADERCMEPAPPVWEEIQRRAAERIRQAVGYDLTAYVAERLKRSPDARMVSLGSGPGGVEFVIAREAPGAAILCLDLNADVLELGRGTATREGLAVEFRQADLNMVDLPSRAFDVVLCHASLHHLLDLERVARQIREALRPGGELVVLDIVTRNGYRMWPETRRVADAVWATLPERYRLNHTAYPAKRVDRRIWERDTRGKGMECLRSEDLIPLLDAHFRRVHFVPLFALCRRFFDTMYGPNYDLGRPLDRAIVGWIWELDCAYLAEGSLRPETVFGVWR
jgi:SAM-dependent methyltransferase